MYTNCYFDNTKSSLYPNGTIFLWDDTKGYLKFPYKSYGYKKDNNGDMYSMTGVRVKKVNSWSNEDIKNGLMYESDVDPVMRTLIDRYYETDDVSINHKILILDIETDISGGASEAKDATGKILAISIIDATENKKYCLVLDEHELLRSRTFENVTIYSFDSELKLLNKFLSLWNDLKPTIITGWNSFEYDIPYIYNRIDRLIGKKFANKLSPINIISEGKSDFGNQTYYIAGVAHLDYMILFKQFTFSQEPNYTLDYIAKKEIGRGKIEYSGSLDDLYKEDINEFIKYNLEDCNLIYDMDKKLDFIMLALSVCHKGHVNYEDIVHTSRYLEGAALTYLKRVGVVATNRKPRINLEINRHHSKGEKIVELKNTIPLEISPAGRLKIFRSSSAVIEMDYIDIKDNKFILKEGLKETVDSTCKVKLNLIGAYVKQPKSGLYEWIYDLDLQSLYPSNIMTLNISPETKICHILSWNPEDMLSREDKTYLFYNNGKRKKLTSEELFKFLNDNNYSIAANGATYRQDVRGFIPTILDMWFEERVQFKDKMKEYGKSGQIEKYKFYYLRQYVIKILLNSFYGVMALKSFRFYDLTNAEAVTSTGQCVIHTTEKLLNNYYNGKLGDAADHAVYCDTDSIFASSALLVKKKYPYADFTDDKLMSKYTLEIASDVQSYINQNYKIFAKKFFNSNNCKFYIKQEMVGKSALWITKKRYAIWLINKEGVPVDEVEYKGLDVIRSDFPKAFQLFMTKLLKDILSKRDKYDIDNFILYFKENMNRIDLNDVLFPSGVNAIVDYDLDYRERFEILKGTPGHIKAALMYNDLLDEYKINTVEKIRSGSKIKYAYLKDNPYNLDSCAIRGYKDPKEIVEFITKYVDYEKMFSSKLSNKIDDFYSALGWESLPKNSTVTNFFEL